jgi:hypothetical protein
VSWLTKEEFKVRAGDWVFSASGQIGYVTDASRQQAFVFWVENPIKLLSNYPYYNAWRRDVGWARFRCVEQNMWGPIVKTSDPTEGEGR